jgi:UDP-2,3-diacylglucosamine pyrophosphatase LpxH
VFISDVHLGFRGCSAEYLLDFLHSIETETLYLVGDIIDLWSLKKSFFWPQQHDDVIRALLDKARRGTRVIYIPGNHDAAFREYDGTVFGNLEIRRQTLHETADGRRFAVLHGDEFDSAVKTSPWLEALGNHAYALLLGLNRYLNHVRRWFGLPYWSIAAYLKHKVKRAVQYMANFERELADEARRRGVDGMICGHTHRAEIRHIDGVLYCNDGDWVESCTTLTEDFSGKLSLLRWAETREVASHTGMLAPVAVTQRTRAA